ncbi:MAG: TrkA family potassium uptake protein [Kiritimatiellae bacterium]|nr:TrkA family potassium uptake protein [Kiritimatiellia bacterium]
MKRIGIIGCGRFGQSLAEMLADAGVEVLLFERNGALVQNASSIVTYAVQGDATNMRALEEAGFKECDIAVVAIGSNIEASMLATANCKEIGVKNVIAKATSEMHGKILTKLGADKIVYPDRESAHRLAHHITNHGTFDLLELSEGLSLAEINVPESCRDKTLAQVDLRKKTGVTVLCIRRRDENPRNPRAIVIPSPNDRILAEDKLIVFGTTKQIDELSSDR